VKEFNPLRISKKLLSDLPFASKPKLPKKRTKPTLQSRRAVIREPHEQKVADFITQVRLIRESKMDQQKKLDRQPSIERKSEQAKEQQEQHARLRKRRREVYRQEGLVKLRAEKRQKSSKKDGSD
jgi:ribosome biogenesis protein BMS1